MDRPCHLFPYRHDYLRTGMSTVYSSKGLRCTVRRRLVRGDKREREAGQRLRRQNVGAKLNRSARSLVCLPTLAHSSPNQWSLGPTRLSCRDRPMAFTPQLLPSSLLNRPPVPRPGGASSLGSSSSTNPWTRSYEVEITTQADCFVALSHSDRQSGCLDSLRLPS
jgi:hypothetical protein